MFNGMVKYLNIAKAVLQLHGDKHQDPSLAHIRYYPLLYPGNQSAGCNNILPLAMYSSIASVNTPLPNYTQ